MRIAQVAPLHESVPPQLYGGTERIVCYLTEELVRRGHAVTLFAAGDAVTSARLAASTPRSLRFDPTVVDPVAHHVAQLRTVLDCAASFEVIHNHMDYLGFLLATRSPTPVVTTLHGRLDLPDLVPLYRVFSDAAVVSISDAQREPFPEIAWQATIHHGIPRDLHRPGAGDGGYLAFVGRISSEKRVDSAIRVADAVGVPLKIAAKVDRVDVEHYESVIKPLLAKSRMAEYVGEIGEHEKTAFLGGALALLFPIDWPEPFGLVMIEALACGTPVIARRRGAVPEVIDDEETGFICDDEAAMVEAVGRLAEIDRRHCRAVFERRFTVERMADDYVTIYQSMIAEGERGAA